jgi:two-component system chemotaxis response regulator CheB
VPARTGCFCEPWNNRNGLGCRVLSGSVPCPYSSPWIRLPSQDIIVIGASAGGVEALTELVGLLPPRMSAALFVVLHVPAWRPSELPAILSRSGPLPASHATEGQLIRQGHIYVAPPDHHMLLASDGTTQLWRGPKENGQRPSINACFRSAAVAYRDRVAGVVLSGMLDDGATGLWWIKQFGGRAIVENPGEARYPDMPLAAIDCAKIDYIVGVAEMGRVLTQLAGQATGTEEQYGRSQNVDRGDLPRLPRPAK